MSFVVEKYDPNKHLTVRKANIRADPPCHGLKEPLQPYNHCMLILGKPQSGKTTILTNLYFDGRNKGSYYGKFWDIFIFNPSKTVDFGVDPDNIYDSLELAGLKRVMEDPDLRGRDILVVLDDVCTGLQDKVLKNKLFELFNNRRHILSYDVAKNSPIGELADMEKQYSAAICPTQQRTGIFGDEGSAEAVEEPRGCGSISIAATSQKYNEVPLRLRNACSAIIIFRPDPVEFDVIYNEVLKYIFPSNYKPEFWNLFDNPHDFIFIDKNTNKLYKNFRRVWIK